MDKEVLKWFAFSQQDIQVANHLYSTFYPMPLEIICYHCQQAAEKSIKALLIACKIPGGMPKQHNLSFLLSMVKHSVDIPDEYYDYADKLTPYGISSRYPNELFLEEHHATEALKLAELIVTWAKEQAENIEQ